MPMLRPSRRAAGGPLLAVVLALLAACAAPPATAQPPAREAPRATSRLPARLADSTFWRMITEFSEPDGYFRSDNLVSNETTFQWVIPELTRTVGTGGVYLGVGPDQNFTYMVALRPRIAFIVDIRRGAMLQHLMYKALVELSADRAEFLALLFGRPRPAGLGPKTSADSLLAAFGRAAPDSALFRRAVDAVRERLTRQHGFALSADDLRGIEYVQSAFFAAGPELTYSYPGASFGTMYGRRRMPTYGELMAQTDSLGVARSYLASETNYRVLRDLQLGNLVVPVVGDFAGDKALRAVGRYLRDHDATVSAFYLSNVEQYLFRQEEDWRRFFDNVATLPVDSTSTFVRAVFNSIGFRDPAALANGNPTVRSVTVRSPIAETVRAVNDGRIQTYYDLIQLSR